MTHKCPVCGGKCVKRKGKKHLEKKSSFSAGGAVAGGILGFAIGGLPGAMIGGMVGGLLMGEEYYECTKCGKTFSVEEIEGK